MHWSKYQEKIYQFTKDRSENAIIQAVAGSGKTTTIIESLNHVKAESAIFLAFNASIAKTMSQRVPAGVSAKTTHAFGLAAIRKDRKYINVTPDRNRDLLKTLISEDDQILIPHVLETISNSKTRLISVEESALLTDARTEEIPQVILYARGVMELADRDPKVIDFDDMIYLPAIGSVKVDPVDFIALDEVQDLNPAQIALVLKASQNGRIVSVGDSRQSIYAFRGADAQAMDRVKEATKAVELPLSICYRCPQSVIDLAREIVPELEARENAPAGIIRSTTHSDMLDELIPDDLVLCRTNAPLIRLAYKMFKGRIPFHMNGRDFGERLIGMYRRAKRETGDNLNEATEYIIADLVKKQEKYNGAEIFADQIEIVRTLADECNAVSDVIATLNRIFDQKNKGVTISTVHRAKGSESDRVFIMHPELIPHPAAKSETDIIQEKNLKYVALTRTRNELVWVE